MQFRKKLKTGDFWYFSKLPKTQFSEMKTFCRGNMKVYFTSAEYNKNFEQRYRARELGGKRRFQLFLIRNFSRETFLKYRSAIYYEILLIKSETIARHSLDLYYLIFAELYRSFPFDFLRLQYHPLFGVTLFD